MVKATTYFFERHFSIRLLDLRMEMPLQLINLFVMKDLRHEKKISPYRGIDSNYF